MLIRRLGMGIWTLLLLGPVTLVAAQNREAELVAAARSVIEEYCTLPIGPIPATLLRNAQGVVVFPTMLKAGLGFGGRHGRGVMLVRQDDGTWSNPVFVVLTGGSVGWQLGLQSSELVLVLKTKRGVDGVLSGNRFTLGVDGSLAVGPVGREAEAATDVSLKSEIYTFSRSRGLYAGLALQGGSLRLARAANQAYYGTAGEKPQMFLAEPRFRSPAVAQLCQALDERTSAAEGETLARDPAGQSGVSLGTATAPPPIPTDPNPVAPGAPLVLPPPPAVPSSASARPPQRVGPR